MPFDIAEFQIPAESEEADPFDYRTFSPGREGLRKLAWVLRHPEVWPKSHRWDFSQVLEKGSCGTAGCAIGVAAMVWPASLPFACLSPLCGDDQSLRSEVEHIFLPTGQGCHHLYGKSIMEVTPLDVADAIDSYLAKSRAPETGGGR